MANIINILQVAPPLVVSQEDTEKEIGALDEAHKVAHREAK